MPHLTAADGTRLFFSDEGDGVPVLALAGLTRAGTDFDFVAPHLDGVRLIRMDYRGRGQSGHADPATYTIPQEGQDALALLDHLGIDKAAILGTSRGGLIAMVLAATAKDRLIGVALNDIGPVIDPAGLEVIKDYVGRRPAQKTIAELAEARATFLAPGFQNIPPERWLAEATRHYRETPQGLALNYDPRLRDAVLAAGAQPAPDLWPLFDAMDGLPLALIRGANSDLLSPETTQEMRKRRPDMVFAEVPDRGHIPFLDEPEALTALRIWIGKLQ